MTGLVTRPEANYRFRGPAEQDGEDVVIRAGTKLQVVDPTQHGLIAVELARLTTPADVVRFVTTYGPLFFINGIDHTATFGPKISEAATKHLREGHKLPKDPVGKTVVLGAEIRESIPAILNEGRALENVLRTASLMRRAADGDKGAAERLAKHSATTLQHWRDFLANASDEDRRRYTVDPRNEGAVFGEGGVADFEAITTSPIEWWTLRLMVYLSDRLRTTKPIVHSERPGHLELRLIGPSLLDFCNLSAMHLIAHSRLEVCPECTRMFSPAHRNQEYCEPRCAGRRRAREFSKRSAQSNIGGGRGKKTRTR